MKRILIAAAAIIAIVSFAYLFLGSSKILKLTSQTCSKDTDCISVCGSCENVTYFDANPPTACSGLSNKTGSRSCLCENNLCVNANSTQPSYIQPQQTTSNNSYIFLGAAVVAIFVIVGAFVNYLMNTPTEMW